MKNKIKVFIIKLLFGRGGMINFANLDFGSYIFNASKLKATFIWNDLQEAKEIYNNHQKAKVIKNNHQKAKLIYNYDQRARVINNNHQKAKLTYNNHQEAKEITTASKKQM